MPFAIHLGRVMGTGTHDEKYEHDEEWSHLAPPHAGRIVLGRATFARRVRPVVDPRFR